jgi:hypothetical protein
MREGGGPRWTDDAIAEALEVNRSTVERVRTRCVEEGVEAALRPRPSRQAGVTLAQVATISAMVVDDQLEPWIAFRHLAENREMVPQNRLLERRPPRRLARTSPGCRPSTTSAGAAA